MWRKKKNQQQLLRFLEFYVLAQCERKKRGKNLSSFMFQGVLQIELILDWKNEIKFVFFLLMK